MSNKIKTVTPLSLVIKMAFTALLFSSLIIQAPPVFAHKVYLFAWVEGDTVYTDSYFSGKKKVQDGIIRVFDKDKELLHGKTNEKGEFSFEIPGDISISGLKLVLESSMGHRGEYLLAGDELPGYKDETGQISGNIKNEISSSPKVSADIKEIKEMMEELLDARLKPISRSLAKIQEDKGPGFTETVGGIGYIFGIMGIFLYIKSRKLS